jgi:hypothetical protein
MGLKREFVFQGAQELQNASRKKRSRWARIRLGSRDLIKLARCVWLSIVNEIVRISLRFFGPAFF